MKHKSVSLLILEEIENYMGILFDPIDKESMCSIISKILDEEYPNTVPEYSHHDI